MKYTNQNEQDETIKLKYNSECKKTRKLPKFKYNQFEFARKSASNSKHTLKMSILNVCTKFLHFQKA